jgi:hypothetical protein
VDGWMASYREMERLRKQERDLIAHGRIIIGADEGPGDPLNLCPLTSGL